MRDEYEFDKMNARPNPYAGRLKRQITIRLGEDVLDYFRKLADETGVPYQNLINLYLRDCVIHRRKPAMSWSGS